MAGSPGRSGALTGRQRGVVLATLAANALIFLDQTAVTVALPAIQADFAISGAELEWTIGAYLLSLAAFIAAAGRLADLFGRKRLFLLGVAVFGAASVACAAAPEEEVLIAARFVQGIGGALAQALALANITAALPAERRGWAVGLLATGGTVFLSLGPLIGGLLVEEASWRWIFGLNVPVVALVLAAGSRSLVEGRDESAPALDRQGLALLLAGLGAIVASLLQMQEWGPGSLRTLGGLAIGAALLAAFVARELRSPGPLIDLRLLRLPLLSGSLAALFVIQFAVLGVTVQLMLFLQHGLGYGALAAGLLFVPASVFTPLLSTTTGALADRHGPRLLVGLGLVGAAAGLAWMGLLARADSAWLLLPGIVIFGAARPFVFTPAGSAALSAIPARERGLASSLVVAARQIGAVLGVTVLGSIVLGIESAEGGITSHGAMSSGFAAAMLVTAALALIAALAALALLRPAR